ncbi:flagellar protein FlaG [Pseudomonas sp. NCHU5208]|uniref:flagellar protein FlaG n=1 Tax=unclassified Pseudomonas TaxID=196821 RepID=UPI003F95E307
MDVGSVKPPVNPVIARDAGSSAATDSRQQPVASSAGVVAPANQGVNDKAQVEARIVEPTQEVSREEVEDAVATIQEFVQSVRRSINFAVDDGSGRVVVKVTDAGSGDVIRQIPSEEALKLAENLSEVRSLLFKAEA